MGLPDKQARFVEEYLLDLNATAAAGRAGYNLPECSGAERGCYVYLLVDPTTGEVFYVGKGTGKRYAAHLREWRSGRATNGAKCAKIDEAVARSGRVLALRFCDGLDDDAAYATERALIEAIGLDRLTNTAPGQETRAERAAFMLSRVKPMEQWLAERPRSPEHRRLYAGTVAALQQMAGVRG